MTRQRHLALHLAALAALSTILPGTGPPGAAAVEDLEAEDVPPECVQVCTPIAQLTARCEAQAEQRFGTDRRWIGQRQVVGGLEREARGRRGKRRSLQRMLGTRLGRRQEGQDESYDSDDSDDEGAATQPRPAPGNAAVGTGQSEAANEAAAESVMRACVCGERGFDVAGAAFGCAACVAQNGTAVEANEDIRQIIAECGFVAAPALTMTAATTPPPAVLAPAISTAPPALLAPAESSTFSTTTVPPTTPPPPPPPSAPNIPPTIPTSSTSLPSAETPATQASPSPTTSSQLPAEISPTQSSESVTPVTVFETPSFSTLPSIVLPNDASSTPPVLDDENQMSGAARGLDMLGHVRQYTFLGGNAGFLAGFQRYKLATAASPD
ncbi:hypothetical protein CT0861_10588 [Colletotrichum tofieldiae]|uniref:Uncharacterized protein n=1 Tax=Colletotrichum tofieldiae TaxID=708197 RepID=A0A161YLQ5_9PEZI|nr:hypothetical protein CT0861_10588 [Colletotrichum tofieldiae]